ncbi:uncharacterized protein LOC121304358 [Polyodon spathula]|uniref:uncharacterized protein LOC121304358 n=1 Tax=Polyodon spathula TaxID=7913 RepID=UPI001B7E1D00|nr:uncharacterized protein LOC121304358 [Polyodon spathula]
MASVPSSSARAAVILCRGNSGLKYRSAPEARAAGADTGRGWADAWKRIPFGLNKKRRDSLKHGFLGVLRWETSPQKPPPPPQQQQQRPGQTRFSLLVSPPRAAGGLAAGQNARLPGETDRRRTWKLTGCFQSVWALGKKLPGNRTPVDRRTAWSNACKINPTRNGDLDNASANAVLRVGVLLSPAKRSHRTAVLCLPSGWGGIGRACFCCTDALSSAFQRTLGTRFQCRKPGELASRKPLGSSGFGAAFNADSAVKSAICNDQSGKELDKIADRSTRAKEIIQETSAHWEGDGFSDGTARVGAEVDQTERQLEALLRRTDPAQSEEARRTLEPRIEAPRTQRERLQASARD